MSLVSVYTNRDIVKKYLDDINNVTGLINEEENQLLGFVISNCAVNNMK